MADLTFLLNKDPAGSSNQFYTLARQYFLAAGSAVVDAPAGGQTFEGVFSTLAASKKAQGTINLVSHAAGFGAMECPITNQDRDVKKRAFSTVWDLEDALKAKALVPPGPGVITPKTRIVIYGCDVGRSLRFLKALCGLFGCPGELLAPKRMGLFISVGGTVKYRQAQTWSIVRKAPLIPAGGSTPAGGWAAFRTAFVTDASNAFADAAILADIRGVDALTPILTKAAKDATAAIKQTYFIEERIPIGPTDTQTAKEVAESADPISNGDPVQAAAQTIEQVDDTTKVTTVRGTDAYPSDATGKTYQISVIVLGQVIDEEVLIADGPNYRLVTCTQGVAPSPGPGGGAGSGGGSGSGGGAPTSQIQTLVDQLLADGAAQEDLDALAAAIPQGDATEGIAMDAPDDTTDTGEIVAPVAPREELA